jgi:hypothetical protein
MSLQLSTRLRQQDAIIYYELSVFNNNTDSSSNPPAISFDEIRNQPFLINPALYLCSVVSFEIETNSLPIFSAQPLNGSNDPNKLIYTMSFSFFDGSNPYTDNLIFTPTDKNVPPPNPPIDKISDLANPYYYMYTYQQFVHLLNVNCNRIWEAFRALNPEIQNIVSPWFYFDVKTSLMRLYVPEEFTQYYKFSVNEALYCLVDTIPAYINEFTTGDKYTFDIIFNGQNIGNFAYPLNGITVNGAIFMEQESSSICSLNPVREIVITSGTLPVLGTLISKEKVFGTDSDLITIGGNNNNFQPILSTFRIAVSNGNTYKNSVVYTPSAEYRMLSLNGGNPLNSIHLEVYWKDKFNNFNRLYLSSGRTATILLMFRLREFNNLD